MQNKNGIKRLVKNSCAGYLGAKQGIPNYCCLQDAPCVFFAQDDDLPCCTYFENGVLPMDEKLVQEYKSDRNVEVRREKKISGYVFGSSDKKTARCNALGVKKVI